MSIEYVTLKEKTRLDYTTRVLLEKGSLSKWRVELVSRLTGSVLQRFECDDSKDAENIFYAISGTVDILKY
jgi:hypothetical protein